MKVDQKYSVEIVSASGCVYAAAVVLESGINKWISDNLPEVLKRDPNARVEKKEW